MSVEEARRAAAESVTKRHTIAEHERAGCIRAGRCEREEAYVAAFDRLILEVQAELLMEIPCEFGCEARYGDEPWEWAAWCPTHERLTEILQKLGEKVTA